ncbi:hypothetical protein [Spirosoma flavum]|uniref:SMP-30/Gluconolactonase/LRE-like region domain-containing protein n=1 Tax=Spirosoma flavum TaxID=2048557 RepID=A0ABW6AK75_9BACT
MLVCDLTYPNGLAFSPDSKTIYVVQSEPKFRPKEALDGLKADREGNCWVAGPGRVAYSFYRRRANCLDELIPAR